MYFVLIWGGIVPPQQKMVSGSSIFGVSFEHGVLGLAYYGILFFLINPVFFAKNISYRILLVALMISIFIELGFKIQFMPFSSLLNKFPQILYLFTFIIPTLLISIGLYFIFNLVVILMKIRTNKKEYFFILLNLSMALSCFKVIHLFSSRYIAQACYFATGFSKEKESKKGQLVSLILLVVGSFAGLYSLYAYYKT